MTALGHRAERQGGLRLGWVDKRVRAGAGGLPLSSCPPHPAHSSQEAFTLAVKEGAPPRARHWSLRPALPWGLLDCHLLGLSCIFSRQLVLLFFPMPQHEFLEKGAHLALCLQTILTCQLHLHILFRVQGGLGRVPTVHSPPVLLPAAAPPSWGQLSSKPGGLGAGADQQSLPTCRPPPDPDQDPLLWRAVATPASTLQPAQGAPSLQGRCPRVQRPGLPGARACPPPGSLLSPFQPRQECRMPRAPDLSPTGCWGQDCRRKGWMNEVLKAGGDGQEGGKRQPELLQNCVPPVETETSFPEAGF